MITRKSSSHRRKKDWGFSICVFVGVHSVLVDFYSCFFTKVIKRNEKYNKTYLKSAKGTVIFFTQGISINKSP